MVTLPKEFVATKYPGYFWNIKDQRLYSVKVTGTLKPLKKPMPNRWNHFRDGWRVSVDGNNRWLELDKLKQLKSIPTIFPVFKE